MCQRPQSTNKQKTPSEGFIYCKTIRCLRSILLLATPVYSSALCFRVIFSEYKVSLSTLYRYLKYCYGGSSALI
jgi:hypothetical protein